MDESGHDFLARARLAGDQDRCVRSGNLGRQPQYMAHGRVAGDDDAAFLRDGRQDGTDQFGIRGQRYIFLCAGTNRTCGHLRGSADPASHDGNTYPLGLETGADAPHVERHIHHEQIGTLTGAKRVEGLIDAVDMGNLRAAFERNLTGGYDVAVKNSNNEKPHFLVPYNGCSDQ